MKRLGIKDFETYSVNPFIVEGIIEKIVIEKKESKIVANTETGEVFQIQSLGEQKLKKIDTQPYKKIYNDSIVTIKDFSIPALKVWSFVLHNLPINSDTVECNINHIKVYTGYKTNVDVYKGLCELIDKKFIARKVGYDSIYFINSNKFFNGNRTLLNINNILQEPEAIYVINKIN